MKKSRLGLLVVAGFGVVAIGFFAWHRYGRKSIDLQPQKSIEEILRERENQAAGELNTPAGKAIIAKNWILAIDEIKKVKKAHLHFANILRALFIQNQISSFSVEDYNSLENILLDLLQNEPEHDTLGYQLLTAQLYRLPLLGAEFRSRKRIEEIALTSTNDTFKNELRMICLSKWIMQGVPPSESAQKRFEELWGKLPTENWFMIVDSIRHAPTQARMIQFLMKRWSTLSDAIKGQCLTLFSNALIVPKNKEVVLSSMKYVHENTSPTLTEASLRYLSALAEKTELNADQKNQIVNFLSKLDSKKSTPYIDAKAAELIRKLHK